MAFFRALFAARTDIYATRVENSRTGWKGWVPAVRGGWQRGIPHEKRDHLPLTAGVLAAHLKGDAHVGVYPLLDGDRCWWVAADFDGQDALADALMYVKAGRMFGYRWHWRCRVPGWVCTRGFLHRASTSADRAATGHRPAA